MVEAVVYPAKDIASEAPPPPLPSVCVAVAKAPPVVHEVPSYSSVTSELFVITPPVASASVCVPFPCPFLLAVFMLFPADHEVPSYSLLVVTSEPVFPPEARPAV